jgi:hypothetical protein
MLWNDVNRRWSELVGRARATRGGSTVAERLDARAALVAVLRSRGAAIDVDPGVAMSRWHEAFASLPGHVRTHAAVTDSPTDTDSRAAKDAISPSPPTDAARSAGEDPRHRPQVNQTLANARKARLAGADALKPRAASAVRVTPDGASDSGPERPGGA